MASSNSRINNGDHLAEEEEEEEYEEIEEEVEEEVEVEEEEEFEEVEEEEEYEEVEEEEEFEEVEEEEPVEEEVEEEEPVEEEVEEEEPEEEPVEEEDVQEEEEEEEEEEYEEVEEEVEVTDDDEDATMAEADCDDEGNDVIDDAAVAVSKSDSEIAVEEPDSTIIAAISDPLIDIVAENACEDGSQHVEPKGDEVCLGSGHTSFVKTEASTCAVEVFCTDVGSLSTELQLKNGEGISSIDVKSSGKSPKLPQHITGPQENYKQGHVEQDNLVSVSEKLVSASDAVSDQLIKLDATDVEELKRPPEEADLNFLSRQSVDEKKSRSWFPQVRSLSPGAERKDGNKRPALICEYFAKGWCIKGSSCRFVHKRDNVDDATKVGGTQPLKIDFQLDKGSGDKACASELLVYNQSGSSSTTGKNPELEHGEGLNFPQYEDRDKISLVKRTVPSSLVSADSLKYSSSKDVSRSISNSREVTDGLEKNHSSSNHEFSVAEGSSMLHQNFFPWRGSSMRELGMASGSGSLLRLVEESAAMRRRYSLDVQSSVPTYHMSSWKNSSLLHKSPSVLGSDSARCSGSYAHDSPTPFKYKTTFTPYNWEPSTPFRSSYFVSPINRPSDVQYDPFRDSIEQPVAARPSCRDSSYSRTHDVHSISGQNSLELHKELQFNNWDNNFSVHDKVVPEVVAESAATSASDAQNKMVEEENPMIPGSVKDILRACRSTSDGKVHNDLLRHGELKVEKGRQPNELDDEESKTIKIFRAALIEFVKELMKPIWHEGRLSKDVYKVIVQKAEDKILSTLQPSQVPSSSEAIKQYLYSSRPKILKLIQAYVDKYGKF